MMWKASNVWSDSAERHFPTLDGLKTIEVTVNDKTDQRWRDTEGGGRTFIFAVKTVTRVWCHGSNGRVADRFRLKFECFDEPLSGDEPVA